MKTEQGFLKPARHKKTASKMLMRLEDFVDLKNMHTTVYLQENLAGHLKVNVIHLLSACISNAHNVFTFVFQIKALLKIPMAECILAFCFVAFS